MVVVAGGVPWHSPHVCARACVCVCACVHVHAYARARVGDAQDIQIMLKLQGFNNLFADTSAEP